MSLFCSSNSRLPLIGFCLVAVAIVAAWNSLTNPEAKAAPDVPLPVSIQLMPATFQQRSAKILNSQSAVVSSADNNKPPDRSSVYITTQNQLILNPFQIIKSNCSKAAVARQKDINNENGPITSGSLPHLRFQDATKLSQDLTEEPLAIAPAVLIEIDDVAVSSAEARAQLNVIASTFSEKMNRSGFDPESPEYRKLWENEQWLADRSFRSLFGDQVWLRHHNASRIFALAADQP